MCLKIDNTKALEGIRKYLTKESEPAIVVEALDDAYYLLAQHMAESIDNDTTENMIIPKGSLQDTMYNIHRLREALCE